MARFELKEVEFADTAVGVESTVTSVTPITIPADRATESVLLTLSLRESRRFNGDKRFNATAIKCVVTDGDKTEELQPMGGPPRPIGMGLTRYEYTPKSAGEKIVTATITYSWVAR